MRLEIPSFVVERGGKSPNYNDFSHGCLHRLADFISHNRRDLFVTGRTQGKAIVEISLRSLPFASFSSLSLRHGGGQK